jgi:DNA-directed RNA polymerase subunit N (RpoN/RPB10)
MLSKSDNWQFYISKIAEDTQLSQEQVNKAIDELVANKYLTKKKVINGKKFYYEFNVYEVPFGFELNFKEVMNNENNIPNKQE